MGLDLVGAAGHNLGCSDMAANEARSCGSSFLIFAAAPVGLKAGRDCVATVDSITAVSESRRDAIATATVTRILYWKSTGQSRQRVPAYSSMFRTPNAGRILIKNVGCVVSSTAHASLTIPSASIIKTRQVFVVRGPPPPEREDAVSNAQIQQRTSVVTSLSSRSQRHITSG